MVSRAGGRQITVQGIFFPMEPSFSFSRIDPQRPAQPGRPRMRA